MAGEYIIPFAVDSAAFLKGISDMDASTDKFVAGVDEGSKKAAVSTRSLFNETEKLKDLQSKVYTEKDIAKIKAYNAQIDLQKDKISQLSNVGRKGYDDLGKALEKTATSTNALSKGFGFIRQAAYLIPGIGIAGIFNVIGEAVITLAGNLIKVKDNFDAVAEKTKVLNEVNAEANKQAGKQITDLRILYSVATDVTKGTDERTRAVKALQAEFPEYFKNISTENILNGNAKTQYDNLTISILETAKATAAKAKLDDIAGKQLDVEFQKQKIRNATAQEIARAAKGPAVVGTTATDEFGNVVETAKVTREDLIKQIEARRDAALKEQDVQNDRLTNQAKFLTAFAGGEGKIAEIIEEKNGKAIKAQQSASDKLQREKEAQLKSFNDLVNRFNGVDNELGAKSTNDDRASAIALSDARFKKIKDDAAQSVKDAKVTEAQRAELTVRANQIAVESDAAAAAARIDINKRFDDQLLRQEEARNREVNAARKALSTLGDNQQDEEINRAKEHYVQLTNTIRQGGLLTEDAQKVISENQQRDIDDINIKFGSDQIKKQTDLAVAGIKVSENYAGKSAAIEKAKQIAILEEQLKGAKAQLALLETNGKDQNDLEVRNAEEVVKNFESAIAGAKNNNGKGKSLFEVLGIDANSQANLEYNAKAISTAGQVAADFFGALIDLEDDQIKKKQEMIDQDNKDLDDLQSRLDKENELRSQGFANNADTIQKELDAKKLARDEDLRNLKEAEAKRTALRKAQLIADTVSQVSNLITSASQIFSSLSGLPFGIGIPLAIAAIGVMFGTFAAAKIKAFQSVGDAQSFGEGGWVNGKPHSQGGKKYRSMDGGGGVVELEGEEHVTKKSQAKKFAPLLDAINSDHISTMDEDSLRKMMAGLGISMHTEAPKQAVKIVRVRDSYKQQTSIYEANRPDISKDVKGIRENVSFLADKERFAEKRWEDEDFQYIKRGNSTTRIKKKR